MKYVDSLNGFGKLYKDFGKWKGNQILDSTFVVKSIKPRFKESSEYGYGFWLGEINKDIFFAMRGILGQYVIVIPEKNTIIVRLGERNNEKDNNRPKDFDVYFKESLKMLENSNWQMKNNSLLSLEKLTVKIDSNIILSEISFQLNKNEILGIVGESGSGNQ